MIPTLLVEGRYIDFRIDAKLKMIIAYIVWIFQKFTVVRKSWSVNKTLVHSIWQY